LNRGYASAQAVIVTQETLTQRELARWLLATEIGDSPMLDSAELTELVDAAERVCQKLCQRGAPLVTATGFQALMTRALRRGAGEFAFLAGVQVGAASATYLPGLRRDGQQLEPTMLRDALTLVFGG
jgi:enoyl-CoA hydratase/carnithine racemase